MGESDGVLTGFVEFVDFWTVGRSYLVEQKAAGLGYQDRTKRLGVGAKKYQDFWVIDVQWGISYEVFR